jgi:hypothetical protein
MISRQQHRVNVNPYYPRALSAVFSTASTHCAITSNPLSPRPLTLIDELEVVLVLMLRLLVAHWPPPPPAAGGVLSQAADFQLKSQPASYTIRPAKSPASAPVSHDPIVQLTVSSCATLGVRTLLLMIESNMRAYYRQLRQSSKGDGPGPLRLNEPYLPRLTR